MSPPTSPTLSPPRPASVSSNSSKHSRDETPQQFFIKTPSGNTTTLTIPPNTSIATVKSLIALQVPSATPSSEARLTFAGRTLDAPDKLLSDYHVPPASTLELTLPVLGGTAEDAANADPQATTEASATAALARPADGPASGKRPPSKSSAKSTTGGLKKKGPRCGAGGCNALAQRIVGDCGFCGGHFCGKHRLLESHACEGLDDARRESKDRNREKLEGERTVSGRVLV